MPEQVFEKIGSRNSCEIDVFWSRTSNPDEKSYDPMVTTAIMRHLPNINDQSDFESFRFCSQGGNFRSLLLDSCRRAGLYLFFILQVAAGR